MKWNDLSWLPEGWSQLFSNIPSPTINTVRGCLDNVLIWTLITLKAITQIPVPLKSKYWLKVHASRRSGNISFLSAASDLALLAVVAVEHLSKLYSQLFAVITQYYLWADFTLYTIQSSIKQGGSWSLKDQENIMEINKHFEDSNPTAQHYYKSQTCRFSVVLQQILAMTFLVYNMQEIWVQTEHLVAVAGDLLKEVVAMELIKRVLLMIKWSNDRMGIKWWLSNYWIVI